MLAPRSRSAHPRRAARARVALPVCASEPDRHPPRRRTPAGTPAGAPAVELLPGLLPSYFFMACIALAALLILATLSNPPLAAGGGSLRSALCSSLKSRLPPPVWTNAAESATLKAARSSSRGRGCTLCGWASPRECRAAQSREARLREVRELGLRELGHCLEGHFKPAAAAVRVPSVEEGVDLGLGSGRVVVEWW